MIICDDCLSVLPMLADGVADLAWTDPPYNCGKDYGIYKDKLPEYEYLCNLDFVFDQLKRIARARAVFTPQKYKKKFWNMLGSEFKEIILTYGPEGIKIKNDFVHQFATILTDAKPVRYCKDVWHNCQMPALGWYFNENSYGHPGYTSEDITQKVIHNLSDKGTVIIDPYGGTLTTARAAKNLGRKYILIEINPDYCAIAKERLAQEELF